MHENFISHISISCINILTSCLLLIQSSNFTYNVYKNNKDSLTIGRLQNSPHFCMCFSGWKQMTKDLEQAWKLRVAPGRDADSRVTHSLVRTGVTALRRWKSMEVRLYTLPCTVNSKDFPSAQTCRIVPNTPTANSTPFLPILINL